MKIPKNKMASLIIALILTIILGGSSLLVPTHMRTTQGGIFQHTLTSASHQIQTVLANP